MTPTTLPLIETPEEDIDKAEVSIEEENNLPAILETLNEETFLRQETE